MALFDFDLDPKSMTRFDALEEGLVTGRDPRGATIKEKQILTRDKINIPSEDIGRGRVEALSDGVFAIVITLLVLEIKVPQFQARESIDELAKALWLLSPKFVSWVISFFTVCVIWLNHHRLFKMINRIDNGLFWWNANLLLWTSFIPFPTALMGDYPKNKLAVSFYGMVMFQMALGFVFMRWHFQRNKVLVSEQVNLAIFRKGTIYSILLGPVAYATGAFLAWENRIAAFICYAVIAVYFIFPYSVRTK